MNAAEAYRARVDAVNEQEARLVGERYSSNTWDRLASVFRFDPRRKLDRNLEAVAAYIEPGDTIVDVGGGAGRVGLPLALRCKELINVEPSPGMGEQFKASAEEAGIKNARLVTADWLDDHGVEGDVTLVFNVTYFVPDIARFVEKLVAASRRRVVISVWSVPPPAQNAKLFRIIHEEDRQFVPGHRELLSVLWEMGIPPDVRVLPDAWSWRMPVPPTRDEAIAAWIDSVGAKDKELAGRRIAAHFDTLFTNSGDGYRPTWRPDPREMLITWATG
jgi:2-polyprenyl-3-methyl-5-hydroxy-6-metoxy-1,4-benzoquinol methylase